MITHIETPRPPVRPNILLILTDQQRADAVGYVNPMVYTPHLNVLASRGIACTSAFVQSPQCQPSRASILTGRYPTAHKVWWNEVAVPSNELTLGNYLSKAGYSTAYFGKLHFEGAGSPTQVANHFGFQTTFLFEDWQQWISAKNMGLKGSGPVESEFYGPMNTKTWTGEFTHRELHHEEVVTEKAIEHMSRAGEPWFVGVGFHGPHPPYASPAEFSGRYQLGEMSIPSMPVYTYSGHRMSEDEWRLLKRQYYGAVSWIDECVGRLLKAAGPNTVVVFTSDHGDILGDHGYFSKGLFAYEGNVKVPLIFRIPGLEHQDYRHLVQSIDVVPTLLQLAGLAVPRGVQGVSLLSGFVHNHAVVSSVGTMIGHSPRLRMVRTPQYKYWTYQGAEFLFDLFSDPDENLNLVSSHPGVLSEMRYQLVQLLLRAEDPLPVPH